MILQQILKEPAVEANPTCLIADLVPMESIELALLQGQHMAYDGRAPSS